MKSNTPRLIDGEKEGKRLMDREREKREREEERKRKRERERRIEREEREREKESLMEKENYVIKCQT